MTLYDSWVCSSLIHFHIMTLCKILEYENSKSRKGSGPWAPSVKKSVPLPASRTSSHSTVLRDIQKCLSAASGMTIIPMWTEAELSVAAACLLVGRASCFSHLGTSTGVHWGCLPLIMQFYAYSSKDNLNVLEILLYWFIPPNWAIC